MKTFSMIVRLGCLGFGLGACYSPGYKDCEITCASGACPSELSCVNGVCRTAGQSGACNVTPGDATGDASDGAPDGPSRPWVIVGEVMLPFPTGGSFVADDPSLTDTMLELYVNQNGEIWRAGRTAVGQPWTIVRETAVNTSSVEEAPHVTADGTLIYLSSNRTTGQNFDLYVAERAGANWTTPIVDTRLSSTAGVDDGPALTDDKLTIVLDSDRDGQTNHDLYQANRPGVGDLWTPPQLMTALNTDAMSEVSPMLSADKLTIYFQVTDPATRLGDLWTASRPTLSQPFGAPTPITELNLPTFTDEDPWVSPDGLTMFFASDRGGNGVRIWEARR